jgi:hypothetical protein
LTNIQIKWCNIALRTEGWVEGLYMNGFEFFSCGRAGSPAALLNHTAGGAFQLHNGLVDSVGGGVELTAPILTKVSNVRFRHTGPAGGTMLFINGGYDVMVTDCSFYGVNNSLIAEHGIWMTNAHSIRLAGNNFDNMLGNGYCIVVFGTSSVVRITDNLFGTFNNQYYFDSNSSGIYQLGNNPPP